MCICRPAPGYYYGRGPRRNSLRGQSSQAPPPNLYALQSSPFSQSYPLPQQRYADPRTMQQMQAMQQGMGPSAMGGKIGRAHV